MPRKKREPSFDELLESIEKMTKRQRQQLMTKIIKENGYADNRTKKFINYDLQKHMRKEGFSKVCPNCGSTIIAKAGEQENGIQRLKCTDCGHRFSYFTGTFLEKTKYSWDVWVEFIYQMILNHSLKQTVSALVEEYLCPSLSERTVFNWRMKILEVAKEVKQPNLIGVVETDEKFIHEGQKGSLHLISPFDKNCTRKARKTAKPSKCGSMGPEFGTILCALDHTGHVVAKYAGVGAATSTSFNDLIGPHLDEMTILCSDANGMYNQYCEYNAKTHYIRPSDYLKTLKHGLAEGKKESAMYRAEMLDYIAGRRHMPYNEFKEFKDTNGLGLGRVNQFHSKLELELVQKKKGISLKNIDGYVAWQALLTNYTVDYGHVPSTRKDAENILILLLKTQKNPLLKEIQSIEPDFSNLSSRYVNKLIEMTENINKKKAKTDARIYITNEDFGPNFDKREFLKSLPVYMIRHLANWCGLPGRSKIKKGNTYDARMKLERNPYLQYAIEDLIFTYGKKKES